MNVSYAHVATAPEVKAARLLALAIIKQAVKDSRSKNGKADAARDWLAGEDCRAFCDALELDHRVILARGSGKTG